VSDAEPDAEHPDAGPSVRNPYLIGNFAPVTLELTVDVPLEVEGFVPPALEGLLVRNGPNPAIFPDPATYHWFTGDGMVHAVELTGGRAVAYRNRWVRTRRLARETGTPAPRGPAEPIDGPANTNVIWHAGRLLALVETGFPHRLTTALETVGVEDFDATLTSPMTAHPKADPDTGGLAFFGYDVFGPPFLRYHEMDAAGSIVHTTEIDIPRATMQHDFAVTAGHVVFLDLPVVFDLDLAAQGRPIPFRWSPEAGARLGVLARGAPGDQVRWTGIEPCFAFHVMNAFDEGTGVTLDLCRYDRAMETAPGRALSDARPTLERWRIDPVSRRVEMIQLDDRAVEFPRVDDTLAGRPYRFGYAVELDRPEDVEVPTGLVRYDLARDEADHWDPGPGRFPSEPIFVRAPDGRSDDEGWVLTVVYDQGRDRSDLVILDGTRLHGPPEAVIRLPARVPFGFHGSWVPATSYR